MDKCKNCKNYMCKELGSYFLKDMYMERCKLLDLFIAPKEDERSNEI